MMTATATRTAKKQWVLISKTTTLQAFFGQFFAVVAQLQHESAKMYVLSRMGTQDNNFLFLFLNFDTVL